MSIVVPSDMERERGDLAAYEFKKRIRITPAEMAAAAEIARMAEVLSMMCLL